MKPLLIFGALLAYSLCFASEEEFARNREVAVAPDAVVISAEYPKPYGKTAVSLTQTNGKLLSMVFRSEVGVISIPSDLLADISVPHLEDAQLTWSIGRRAQEIHASVAIPFGALQGDPLRYSKRSFTIVDGKLRYTILYTPSKDWYETKYTEINSVAAGGLQMAIFPVRESWIVGDDPEFEATLRNSGTNDLFLNLGITLANGRRHFPNSISLVLVDSRGHSRQLELVGPAGTVGRVDDYPVGLQAGAVHVLRMSLSEFWCPSTNEYELKLPEGQYKITARFRGHAAGRKNTGMDWTAWSFWEGTLESGAVEFEIREPK